MSHDTLNSKYLQFLVNCFSSSVGEAVLVLVVVLARTTIVTTAYTGLPVQKYNKIYKRARDTEWCIYTD